ncbi:UNVERIFIED_CONTAM: hypothetical protein NY603_37355, partial [Bacteroidetes bacterium 56_B9]
GTAALASRERAARGAATARRKNDMGDACTDARAERQRCASGAGFYPLSAMFSTRIRISPVHETVMVLQS